MDQFEQEEFWKSLGRLYDATQALRTATEALHGTMEMVVQSIDNLRVVAENHEKRLERLEGGAQ